MRDGLLDNYSSPISDAKFALDVAARNGRESGYLYALKRKHILWTQTHTEHDWISCCFVNLPNNSDSKCHPIE